MAKRKNEEGVFNRTSSPSKNQDAERKAPAKKVSRKQQFEVVGTPGRNFAIGGRYFNTSSEDWYSPGGRKLCRNCQQPGASTMDLRLGAVRRNMGKSTRRPRSTLG